MPPVMTSIYNVVYVQFKTDDSWTFAGFNATYSMSYGRYRKFRDIDTLLGEATLSNRCYLCSDKRSTLKGMDLLPHHSFTTGERRI